MLQLFYRLIPTPGNGANLVLADWNESAATDLMNEFESKEYVYALLGR